MAQRVNVNFSDDTYAVLKEIAEKKGNTMSEVLRDAIALEEWVTDELTSGSRLLVERQDGEVREVIRR
ncbi:MAG: ribbon-helix-helix protein, CopG family [Anaerolineales bacterium]|nr:MAG: ribbon-helix-helix protein, CopG family [Anaerolineales bacterium]